MRKYLILLILLLSISEAKAQYNCKVTTSDRETVTFRVTGYGKKVKLATEDAELSAVKTLCFIGAAGTSFRLPLVSQGQTKAEKDYSDFFDNFYGDNYRNFIETSSVVVPFGKDGEKRKCITLDVRVRASQLRTHLEQSGVIRKFGL